MYYLSLYIICLLPLEVLEETLTSESFVTDSTLLTVANYTLNDEAARTENIKGIESKFYSLSKFNIIAFASIFTIEITKTKTEVFSFMLVLPYSETSEFLARYQLCEVGVQKLLQDCLIRPLNELQVIICVHSDLWYIFGCMWGGIVQWQSVRLQIERSLVQIRVLPGYDYKH